VFVDGESVTISLPVDQLSQVTSADHLEAVFQTRTVFCRLGKLSRAQMSMCWRSLLLFASRPILIWRVFKMLIWVKISNYSGNLILNYLGGFSTVVIYKNKETHDRSEYVSKCSILHTPAFNSLNLSEVTGGAFVIFNASLKSTDGFNVKTSIVEDGIMIQAISSV